MSKSSPNGTPEGRELGHTPDIERQSVAPQPTAAITEIVEGTAKAAAPESTPEERVTFAEAAKLLEGRLNLVEARDEAVKAHMQWGYVDAMIREGRIGNHGEYEALFNEAMISEKTISEIKRNPDYMPIFDAGLLLPHEQLEALFQQGGIPFYLNTYGAMNLADIRKITPTDFVAAGVNIATLHDQSEREQEEAFKAAYEQASPLQPTGTRILFTPSKREITPTTTPTTPTKDMQFRANGGTETLDIAANLIRFRSYIDLSIRRMASRTNTSLESLDPEEFRIAALKCLEDLRLNLRTIDIEAASCSSDCVYPNGGAVTLDEAMHPAFKGVLNFHPPSTANIYIPSRPALS